MKTRMIATLASVLFASCFVPVGVEGPGVPYWDGHVYVTVPDHTHCVGCGHCYYDSGWNLYPQNHVYVQAGYARHSEFHGHSDGSDHHR